MRLYRDFDDPLLEPPKFPELRLRPESPPDMGGGLGGGGSFFVVGSHLQNGRS